ncbi:MAG: hypothetical protein HY975_03985 [Candidatus Kerfeldbacteria bacterium]|nr:hypothetical protein [Candidatus Kerfeldbacteria bacterium]
MQTVLVQCTCGAVNAVTPVTTEKRVWPDFSPYRCTSCRQVLKPTPLEWNGIVTTIADIRSVPDSWWNRCVVLAPRQSIFD